MVDIYYSKNVKTNYNISLNEFKVLAEHADFSILRKWNNKKGSYELSNKLCNLVYEIHLQIGTSNNLNNWIHVVASNLGHDYDYIKGAAHKYKKT